MKTNFKMAKALFIALMLVPSLFILQSSQSGSEHPELKIGKKAPKVSDELLGADGNSYTLEGLTEKNGLIVVFSCNTCPFVVGSDSFEGWEKQYNDLHKIAKANNIGMVLVNSNAAKRDNADSMEEMKKRAQEKGYTMPYVVDENSALANAFGAKTTPHVYVFNAGNKLIYRGSIDNSWDSKRTEEETYLLDAIEEINAGKPISTETSSPRGCSIKRK